MSTCEFCGHRIEFRMMGGRPTPIHVDGNWCPGNRSAGTSLPRPFQTVHSYVNPNAYCPVCGKRVYYYRSPEGGRVFFDDLGWPWPKHKCTDTRAAQNGVIHETKIRNRGTAFIRREDGEILQIYDLVSLLRCDEGWQAKFKRASSGYVFKAVVSDKALKRKSLKIEDLEEAPSFLMPPSNGQATRQCQFICARHRRIMTIEVSRA
jgi:hypothetical protein